MVTKPKLVSIKEDFMTGQLEAGLLALAQSWRGGAYVAISVCMTIDEIRDVVVALRKIAERAGEQ